MLVNLDSRLGEVVRQFGPWVYAILFLATFAKSGLIYVPVLPTTTLAFAAGALASPRIQGLDIGLVCLTLVVAAWLGDIANYGWGRWLGPNIAHTRWAKHIRLDRLDRAGEAYRKHGFQLLLISRWVSVLRSTVPFVAGSSRVPLPAFVTLNLLSCVIWVVIIAGAGYGFGHLPWVRDRITLISVGILVALSIPLVVSLVREKRRKRLAIGPENDATPEPGT